MKPDQYTSPHIYNLLLHSPRLWSSINFRAIYNPIFIPQYAEIIILLCQGFSEKIILPLLSNQTRYIFDDLYRAWILGRYRLGSSTVDETAETLFTTLHGHEIISEFYKHEIKQHPSTTSIFVRFFITAKISDPLQEISQMKRYINVLSTNPEYHHGRLTKLEE